MRSSPWAIASCLLVSACTPASFVADAVADAARAADTGARDAGANDGGPASDGGTARDAGGADDGGAFDAGALADAGADAGARDAGRPFSWNPATAPAEHSDLDAGCHASTSLYAGLGTVSAVHDGHHLVLRKHGDGGYDLTVNDGGSVFSLWSASVTLADVDQDGTDDLLVGDQVREALRIFKGPVTTTQSLDAADLRIAISGPPSGLWGRFSHGVLVVDANGDGVKDLIVTAPAEEEEACFGARPPRLFVGPFRLDGGVLAETDGIALDAPPSGVCVGEAVSCLPGRVALISEYQRRCWAYALPLDAGAPPQPCPN